MTVTRGRPRSFDKERVLDEITHAFWRGGYDGTSVADLTRLTGLTPPSLYAAFGDKRRLFAEVLAHYQRSYGAFSVRALAEEPTAYLAISRMLREAAAAYTDPAHPQGCLVISAATGSTAQPGEVFSVLRDMRDAARRAVADRIAADVRAGRLPPSTDPESLAAYFATVVQGMSNQARDGAGRETLEQVATLAMAAWPAHDQVDAAL